MVFSAKDTFCSVLNTGTIRDNFSCLILLFK